MTIVLKPCEDIMPFQKGNPSWRGKKRPPFLEEWKRHIAESLKGNIPWMKGKHHTPEANLKNAKAHEGTIPWNKGKTGIYSQDTLMLMSSKKKNKESLMKGKHFSEEAKVRMRLSFHKPRRIALIKEARKRQVLPKSRTKPELKLLDIIERHGFPFKYTGDGSFWIGNYNPDFVNCDGKKKIIEVFGDYWHNPSRRGIKLDCTEAGRGQAFAEFGFGMLVIWEHELKTLPEEVIVSKVRSFLEAM